MDGWEEKWMMKGYDVGWDGREGEREDRSRREGGKEE